VNLFLLDFSDRGKVLLGTPGYVHRRLCFVLLRVDEEDLTIH
jgi:hypothetical protein